jgi:hypothetical protein
MKVWSSDALLRLIALVTTSLIGILAFWHGLAEGGFQLGVFGFVLAPIAPAVCWGVTLRRERRRVLNSACRLGASFVTVIGIFVYWSYVVAGRSDPDTAKHMLVVLFPIVYGLLAVIVLVPLLLIDTFRSKKSMRVSAP